MDLYDDLAPWWPLLSPPHHFDDEAAQIARWMGASSILELGSGAGLLASQLPADIDVELLDRSEAMLAVSRSLNPGRTHHALDMRTARLGRTFGGVLLHDAVMYLLTEDDLRATFLTAWEHLEPGGCFVVLPDFAAEDFQEHTASGGGADGDRAIQLLEWHWAHPDGTVHVEFSALLRQGDTMRAVHETHQMGLHSRQVWWDLLRGIGFVPVELPWDDLRIEGEALVLRRPA